MKYLARLNFSKDKDSIELFNSIESYLLQFQPRLTPDFISSVASPREVPERRH